MWGCDHWLSANDKTELKEKYQFICLSGRITLRSDLYCLPEIPSETEPQGPIAVTSPKTHLLVVSFPAMS